MDIKTQITKCTTRVVNDLRSGGQSVGTGFFYAFDPEVPQSYAVITNRHVVEDCAALTITVNVKPPPEQPALRHNMVSIQLDDPHVIFHPDPECDLAAIPFIRFGQEINAQLNAYAHFTNLSRTDALEVSWEADASAIEQVIMPGYPNGLYDDVNNIPIVRTGVTATPCWVDYKGKAEFVIDCACFEGSSGSPVFINRGTTYSNRSSGDTVMSSAPNMRFGGILFSGPLVSQQGTVVVPGDGSSSPAQHLPTSSQAMMNLGYVIKARRIEDMRPSFRQLMIDCFAFDIDKDTPETAVIRD